MKKFIDLTMPLSPQTVVFPGDASPSITKVSDYSQNGYYDSLVSFNLHNSTHVDAPKHFVEGGAAIDSFQLSRFSCKGILINALGVKEIGKDLFQKQDIARGDAVLVWTNHSDKARFKDYFQTNPVISEEAAQYLASRKPSLVGIDSFSVDNSPFPVHKKLLSNDVLVVENLTNLASLDGKKFKFLAFPLKIPGVEASPVRAMAELYEDLT